MNWIKVNEKLVYDGYRKILRRTFKLPGGKETDFDVIQSYGGAVAILAITNDNKIICFQQFRPGPEEILFELPGGGVEEGEDPAMAIARELKEETGYTADIEFLGSYFRDAYIAGRWQMFIGRNARKISEPMNDGAEPGQVTLLSIKDFKEKLFAGLMTDTTLGYAGLLRLGLL